jgi:hypothetical protein
MKKYRYSVSTNTIWASFDYGDVEAENIEDARVKAIEKLKYDFKKANDALEHCDITKGFTIGFSEADVDVFEM